MNNFSTRVLSSFFLATISFFILYYGSYLFYFSLIFLCFLSFYEVISKVKQKYLIYFLLVLILSFMFSLISIRSDNYENFIKCIWLISIVSMSDIGGYSFGKIFKGPKLSKISPNKTISGLVGSILFSQISIFIPFYFLDQFEITVTLIILQFFLCLSSIAGDIFFSFIKRINNIKDYSKIIPGHGGILDRIDGMIFAVIFYNLIMFINAK